LSSQELVAAGSVTGQIYAENPAERIEGNDGDDQIFASFNFDGLIFGGSGVDACGDAAQTVTSCETVLSEPPFDPEQLWAVFFSWYG
jgi:hypothetical protein